MSLSYRIEKPNINVNNRISKPNKATKKKESHYDKDFVNKMEKIIKLAERIRVEHEAFNK